MTARRQQGFTLMEVLVAVTILALAMLAAMQNFSVSLDGARRLEKAFADDFSAALALDRLLVPGLGERSDRPETYVRGWRYRVVVVREGAGRGFVTMRLEEAR